MAGLIRIVILPALIAVYVFTPNAQAKDPEIRRITQKEATSDCIGDPRTPLCAAETFLACWVRKDRVLCDSVRAPSFKFSGPEVTHVYLDYKVEEQRTIHEEDVTDDLRGADWFKPGFVRITFSLDEKLTNPTLAVPSGWQKYDVTVRQANRGWRVVSWSLWGAEDFSNER